MTISNQASIITYAGDGVTTVWNYGFLIPFQDDGITPAVSVTTNTLGVETNLTTLQYVITGVNNPAGGTVTVAPALAVGTSVTIWRTRAYTQGTAVANTAFYPNTVEIVADDLVTQIQQLYSAIGGCIRVGVTQVLGGNFFITNTPSQRAGTVLGFDSSGNLALEAGFGAVIATIEAEIATLNSEVTTINGEIITINDEITTINGQITTLTSSVTLLQQKTAVNVFDYIPTADLPAIIAGTSVVDVSGYLTAAHAAAGEGGSVTYPAGLYNCVNVQYLNGQSIIGAGSSSTILQQVSPYTGSILVPYNWFHNLTGLSRYSVLIAHMGFKFTGSSISGYGIIDINYRGRITECDFTGKSSTGFSGGIQTTTFTKNGTSLGNDVAGTHVTNCQFKDLNLGAFTAGPAGAYATGTFTTGTGTDFSNGDTITIGTRVYTFKAALTPADGEIHLSGTYANTLLHFEYAVNDSGGVPGTDYYVLAADPSVTAGAPTSTTIVVTEQVLGLVGNSIATTSTMVSTSAWGAVTLLGGLDYSHSTDCYLSMNIFDSCGSLDGTIGTIDSPYMSGWNINNNKFSSGKGTLINCSGGGADSLQIVNNFLQYGMAAPTSGNNICVTLLFNPIGRNMVVGNVFKGKSINDNTKQYTMLNINYIGGGPSDASYGNLVSNNTFDAPGGVLTNFTAFNVNKAFVFGTAANNTYTNITSSQAGNGDACWGTNYLYFPPTTAHSPQGSNLWSMFCSSVNNRMVLEDSNNNKNFLDGGSNIYPLLTALAGGGQAGATPIKFGCNVFHVVASLNDSGVLPPATGSGNFCFVRDNGAQTMAVFPAGTDTINNGAAGAMVQVTTVAGKTFYDTNAGAWNTTP